MKIGCSVILSAAIVGMAFNIFSLRKELQGVREQSVALEERNDILQRELMRVAGVNSENERFLDELEQSIREFDSKMPFDTLEKYIPKSMSNDIKPIIDRIRVFQEARENTAYQNIKTPENPPLVEKSQKKNK